MKISLSLWQYITKKYFFMIKLPKQYKFLKKILLIFINLIFFSYFYWIFSILKKKNWKSLSYDNIYLKKNVLFTKIAKAIQIFWRKYYWFSSITILFYIFIENFQFFKEKKWIIIVLFDNISNKIFYKMKIAKAI